MLAAGEIPGRLVAQVLYRQEIQCGLGRLSHFLLAPSDGGRVEPIVEDMFARLRGRHDHEVLQNRHLREFMGDLKGPHDAAMGSDDTGYDPHCGGLAGPVRADEHRDSPWLNLQGQVDQSLDGAK